MPEVRPGRPQYAAARRMADVGLRVNEARCLDLADVKWELGRFCKLHIRYGEGRPRLGPAGGDDAADQRRGTDAARLIADVRGLFGDDYARHGAPLFPASGKTPTGAPGRAGAETLQAGLAAAAAAHLPEWEQALTPHVLRHFCASQFGSRSRHYCHRARAGAQIGRHDPDIHRPSEIASDGRGNCGSPAVGGLRSASYYGHCGAFGVASGSSDSV
jgi:hypothetical protein